MLTLEILLLFAFVFWFGLAVFMIWATRGGTILRPGQEAAIEDRAPKVSIIVPARNEADALPSAMESLLNLDYPDYEVILVDDGSTDSTGRIADDWAARPEAMGRLQVIHNHELPEGWTGKVHALSLAARAATGDWILATDADVVFHPEILKLAVSLALQKEVQFLSITPEFELGGFWEKTVLPAFTLLLATLFPLRLVNHPRFPRAIAAGAFILMRRADFEALGGYVPIKNVVIEDVRMAEQFKRHGRRVYLAASRGLFRTRMYTGVHELWEGLSRSAFEGTGFSVLKILGGACVGAMVAILPFTAMVTLLVMDLVSGRPLLGDTALAMAAETWGESLLIYLPVLVFLRVPWPYVFTLPLAALFYTGVGWNSMFRSLFGSGVPWKGRNYRPPS